MVHDSIVRLNDDDKLAHILIIIAIESTALILDTHSMAYIWQTFYKSNAFRDVCLIMIKRECNMQKKELTCHDVPDHLKHIISIT